MKEPADPRECAVCGHHTQPETFRNGDTSQPTFCEECGFLLDAGPFCKDCGAQMEIEAWNDWTWVCPACAWWRAEVLDGVA